MKRLSGTAKQSEDRLEYWAELLDCAGNLIELAAERMQHSRELSAFAKIERIAASRELIEYTRERKASSRLRLGLPAISS